VTKQGVPMLSLPDFTNNFNVKVVFNSLDGTYIKSSQVDYPSTLDDSTLIILVFKMLRFSNFISSK
jgi:hypothetical protein